MTMNTYEWARTEYVREHGATLVRLSDGGLAAPLDTKVIDLETGVEPVDSEGRKRAVVSVSEHHIEFFDYDAAITGDEFPTRHLAGRYSVSAKPLEF